MVGQIIVFGILLFEAINCAIKDLISRLLNNYTFTLFTNV